MTITGNEPYFPFFVHNEDGYGHTTVVNTGVGIQYFPFVPGVSIRQEFAKAAMQGLLSGDLKSGVRDNEIAIASVKMADELIAELNRTDETK